MGYEYISQPQVFLAPITAVYGFQNPPVTQPFHTSFQHWTSSTSGPCSAWPIPTNITTMLEEPASFIVTVGGVVQSPDNYTINRNLRLLTFTNPICAGVEIGVAQMGTVALTSQYYNDIQAVSGFFANVSANRFLATNSFLCAVTAQDVYVTRSVFDTVTANNFVALSSTLIAVNVVAIPTSATSLTANDFCVLDEAEFRNGLLSEGPTVIEVNTSNLPALRINQTGAGGNALVVEDETNPDSTPLVVNSDGQLIIGATTSLLASAVNHAITTISTVGDSKTSNITMTRVGGDTTTNSSRLRLVRGRGAVGSMTGVVSGDNLGGIIFGGVNEQNSISFGAQILSDVDAGPIGASVPANITFSTVASGQTDLRERMRITNLGNIGIGTTNPTATLHVSGGVTVTNVLSTLGPIAGNNSTVSFNQGLATGQFSFAVNDGNALNQDSFAANTGTASGQFSFAEGQNTTATRTGSHAEGVNTTSSGVGSHSEGSGTNALSAAAHAEGTSTTADGSSSHAEGQETTATGTASHSEGFRTFAQGYASHTQGYQTSAFGTGAHAEGFETVARGEYSRATGGNTRARGDYSQAAGRFVEAGHARSWIWKGGGSTDTTILSTTRTDQFVVSAANGIVLSNRVGIGVDNNLNALTVVGDISATGNIISPESARWNSTRTTVNTTSGSWSSVYSTVNTNSADYIIQGGNSRGQNLLVGSNDNFSLTLETNALPRVTITNGGNVGIGATSPSTLLQVGDGSAQVIATVRGDGASFDTGLRIWNDNTGNSAAAFLDFGLGTVFNRASIQARAMNDNSADLVLQASDTSGTRSDNLYIDGSSGNISIGGAGTTGGRLSVLGTSTILRLAGQGDDWTGLRIAVTDSSATVIRSSFIDVANENDVNVTSIHSRLGTDGSSTLSFLTTVAGARNVDRREERMRISSTGRVGIGNTDPQARLHVEGSIFLAGETSPYISTGLGAVDEANRTNTYIAFGPAGTGSDWAYLRQIGTTNQLHLALDFHDDGNDSRFSIRDIQSTANPDATPVTRFTVTGAGNVGINTATPGNRLSIRDGDIALISGVNAVDAGHSIRFFANGTDDVTNNYAEIKGGLTTASTLQQGYLRFSTSGTERMRIGSTGNVGIGTNNPNNTLHVVGAVRVDGTIFGQNAAGQGDVLVVGNDSKLVDINVENILGIQGNQNSDRGGIRLGSAGATIWSNANSNLGIHTTSPAAPLHVNGNTAIFGVTNAASSIIIDDIAGAKYRLATGSSHLTIQQHTGTTATDYATWTNRLQILNGGNIFIPSPARVGIHTNTPTAPLQIFSQDSFTFNTASSITTLRIGSVVANEGTSEIQYDRASGAFSINTGQQGSALTTRLFINTNGLVGIGTASPSTRLMVVSNGTTYTNPSDNNLATIRAVNTTNNSVNAHAILALHTTGAGGGNPFISYDVNGVAGWSAGLDNADGDKYKIASNWGSLATETRLTIDRGGNVGIGITNPAYVLDVAGVVRAQAATGSGDCFIIGNDTKLVDINVANTCGLQGLSNSDRAGIQLGSAGPTLYGAQTGNLGISTTSPTERLTINGRIAFVINAGDEGNCGKIDYRSFDGRALSIVGANTVNNSRIVRIWDTLTIGYAAAADNSFNWPTAAVIAGNVGIGTNNPESRLHIAGGRIRSEIQGSTWINGHRGSSGITFTSNGDAASYWGWMSQRTASGGFSLGTLGDIFRITWATAANINSETNNITLALNLDSAGNLSVPGRINSTVPYFYARTRVNSAGQAPGGGTPIGSPYILSDSFVVNNSICTNWFVEANVGGGTFSGGRYTVPVAGVYFITFWVTWANSGGSDFIVSINDGTAEGLNGTSPALVVKPSVAGQPWVNGSISYPQYLPAGATISVRTSSFVSNAGSMRATFSAYLIG